MYVLANFSISMAVMLGLAIGVLVTAAFDILFGDSLRVKLLALVASVVTAMLVVGVIL